MSYFASDPKLLLPRKSGVAMLEIEFHFKLIRKPKTKKITVQADLEQ